MSIPGAPPPSARELVRAGDRISFLYVEHALISRQDSAVTLTSERGVVHVPAAQLLCLLIGPGCRITHHATMLLADSGTSVIWVGEKGVRFYAAGRGLSRSARMIEAQARLVLNERSRLAVAREMYAQRFPGEDVAALTMQQLRGRRARGFGRCTALTRSARAFRGIGETIDQRILMRPMTSTKHCRPRIRRYMGQCIP